MNACHGGITPGARYARSGWKRRAGGGRIDFTVASRLRIEVSRHFVATWTAAVRFAVYQLAFLLFEAAVTLRALLGDYRMSSGFSHYLHSLRWHRNTPGQSWWAVATNMTRGVSQHLPFLVLTPACLAVDAQSVSLLLCRHRWLPGQSAGSERCSQWWVKRRRRAAHACVKCLRV